MLAFRKKIGEERGNTRDKEPTPTIDEATPANGATPPSLGVVLLFFDRRTCILLLQIL